MTGLKEENPESKKTTTGKLVLGGSKLSLNKSVGTNNIVQKVSGSKSTTVVEVKKNKLTFNTWQNKPSAQAKTASDEFNKRLNLLKKAAEDSQSQKTDPKFSSLSKLAAANRKSPEQESFSEEPGNLTSEDNQHTTTPTTEPEVKDKTIKTEALKGKKSYPEQGFDEEGNLIKKPTDKAAPQKAKLEEPKRLKKADIFHMLDDDSGTPLKTRSLASIRRAKEKEKRKLEQSKQEKVYREVIIPETITVGELASRMTERVSDVIRELMKLGVIASSSQAIEADTAGIIVSTFGHTFKMVQESDVENILTETDSPEDLKPRAPIVTVMGHVDHGKTSLLDALKSTDVAGGEEGGITQHIGAYRVTLGDGRAITFIDTPGHEAFTEMRTRGAQVTDIVVLVVAADDGIKTQTIEAISHAKAANVPIIVAINKIDKPDIDLTRVKNELLSHNLVPEDLGGDIMVIPVSALKKTNLDKLEEAILLVAEMQELKANPDSAASGTVIEARIDKARGVVATVLVTRGTLKKGDLVVAGKVYGRIKRIVNDKGTDIDNATPSEPAELYGLSGAPKAGDRFNVVQNEKQARDITEYRQRKSKEKKNSLAARTSLDDLFLKASGAGNIKELPIIIKADVQGSIEAITGSLVKIPNEEIKLKVLLSAVGGVTESDVALAQASHAIIIGFNVRASNDVTASAEKEKVDIRYYSIIYNLIDDMKALMSGMLAPIIREQYIGSVEIRQVFNITKVGKIAGSYVTKGMIKRGAGVRLLRDNIIIHEGKLKTLKRFKEDVKEVKENFECGIAFENYEDIKVGDTVEVFEVIEERKQL